MIQKHSTSKFATRFNCIFLVITNWDFYCMLSFGEIKLLRSLLLNRFPKATINNDNSLLGIMQFILSEYQLIAMIIVHTNINLTMNIRLYWSHVLSILDFCFTVSKFFKSVATFEAILLNILYIYLLLFIGNSL